MNNKIVKNFKNHKPFFYIYKRQLNNSYNSCCAVFVS